MLQHAVGQTFTLIELICLFFEVEHFLQNSFLYLYSNKI